MLLYRNVHRVGGAIADLPLSRWQQNRPALPVAGFVGNARHKPSGRERRVKDVFISYAHEDRASAQALADCLDKAGISVWWDPQLQAGQQFAKVIEQTLQRVRCVIVLWSRHSVVSDWVNAEASEGLRLGKLLPVLLDDSTPPLIFRGLHTLSLPPSDLYPGAPLLDKLLHDIRARTRTPSVPVAAGSRRLLQRLGLVSALLGTVVAIGATGLAAAIIDVFTGALGGSSLEVTPLLSEGMLAALGLVLIVLASRRLRHRVLLLSVGLLLFGVLAYAWLERSVVDVPDHLFGRIISHDWQGLQVAALGATGSPVALQSVPVDSDNGSFGLRLQPVFADRPRWLLVEKPGCKSERHAIRWSAWRTQQDIEIDFRCN
jgi:hypothetical protein